MIGEGCGRSAGGHVSGVRGAIFMCAHTSPQKALKWATLGLTMQQRGVQGECGGRGDRAGVQEESGGHVSWKSEASEEGF